MSTGSATLKEWQLLLKRGRHFTCSRALPTCRRFQLVQGGKMVGNVRNDGAELIDPTDVAPGTI